MSSKTKSGLNPIEMAIIRLISKQELAEPKRPIAWKSNGSPASICVGVIEYKNERPHHNLQIEPHRPLFDILGVVLDPLLQFFDESISPRNPLICAHPVRPGFTR